MISPIKSILVWVYYKINLFASKSLLILSKALLGNRSQNLQLAYNSKIVTDGLGAQLQRQFAILSLANYLNAQFVPQQLENIAIHPLDSFQTIEEMKQFLIQVNMIFGFDKGIAEENSKLMNIQNLKSKDLFFIALRIRVFGDSIRIVTAETYGVSDSHPKIYEVLATQNSFDFSRYSTITSDHANTICMHYRQGVGGQVIYPGQKIPREMDLDYFVRQLDILDPGRKKKLLILTDAPNLDFRYSPTSVQRDLWEDTPKYVDGVLNISGIDLEGFFQKLGFQVSVIAGGDLLITLMIMVHSEILIMSRSSLSYVGSLLNSEGKIVYPPDFWHPPLAKWLRG